MRFDGFKPVAVLATLGLMILACNLQAASVPTATSEALSPTVSVATAMAAPSPTPPPPMVPHPEVVSLDMLDQANGWAIGDKNVLRTSDGGASWYNVTPPGVSALVSTQGEPAACYFLDPQTGWVDVPGADPTTSGTFYRTTDGGATWASSAVPFGSGWIKFLDPRVGWDLTGLSSSMSGHAVAVFTTADGGVTWSRVFVNDPTIAGHTNTLPLSGYKNGITALDNRRAWVTGSEEVSDFAYLYDSQDGGHTWKRQNLALPSAYAGGAISTSVPSFFGTAEGVLPVVMMAETNGVVFYVSHDAGQTWTASHPVPEGGFVSVASAADFFVWDGSRSLNVSHDAGATWSVLTANVDLKSTLQFIQFVDAKTGWALTQDPNSHHSLYKTINGGATWRALLP